MLLAQSLFLYQINLYEIINRLFLIFVLFSFSIDLHISGSQSSLYSHTMATIKSKTHVPSAGLTNELYFASHKPDGDNEKTPPVLLRGKRRSTNLPTASNDSTLPTVNSRRPISSPVRSTTYVLQQHHRISNNHNDINNKKLSSPVHHNQSSTPTTSVTLNKHRQTHQQRLNINQERLPVQTSSTIESTTTNQQLAVRAHNVLTPRRTSPIVKNTPTKTTAYTSRSPRVRIIRILK